MKILWLIPVLALTGCPVPAKAYRQTYRVEGAYPRSTFLNMEAPDGCVVNLTCTGGGEMFTEAASPVAKVDKLTPFLRDAAVFFWGVALGCVGFYLYVRYLFS